MLIIKDISKNFLHPVLCSVNISLKQGTSFVLLGPNGAGKTTLLKIISSTVLPDSGSITINGMDIGKNQNEIRNITGFSFSSERSFYMRLTGMDNLIFFSAFYSIKKSKLENRLHYLLKTLVFPEDMLSQPVMNYSSGQRQLLSIIRALLHEPQYFFIDEPSISLDEKHSSGIITLIKNEVIDGKTAIIVTHSIEEARLLSPHIGIINDGVLNYDPG